MAPSRRKGANKGAAAAAACSKWKIGDLVLAKVKGFPAWPARVSEPKNWGFKKDLKKVFVYFFGTGQIAFCTPADVESFTEEKKVSLLGKRHGKGADFVRAVNEIIDSYEELKTEEQDIDPDCTNEIAEINDTFSGFVPDNKMADSLHKSSLKDEDIPLVIGPELEVAESTGDDSDFTSLADAAVSELEKSSIHGHELLEKEPSLNVVVTYSSRRKLENMQITDCITQTKVQPARRSRSSRVDNGRLENFMTLHVDDSSNLDMVANISRDITGRRSKRPRRSPDGSGRHLIDSGASISNGSNDEKGADTVTISDCFGFNDESNVDSACKSMLTESPKDCGLELEPSRQIDFQSTAVIFRKKRKQSRKRTCNETIEFTAGLDKVENVDSELSKTGHALPSDHGKVSDNISKENGDEHLPLVKRARVRMGASPHRPPSAGEQTNSQDADKISDILKEIPVALNSELDDSANCNSFADRENDSANGNSHTDRGECDDLSPSNATTSKKLLSWEVTKSQPFSSLVDGEAALPPSKRLHRALEAMSANAAEDDETPSVGPFVMNTSVNGYSSSYSGVCHRVKVESRVGGEVESNDDAPKSDPSIAEETSKTSEELTANGRTSNNDDHPIDESCNDTIKASESREFKHFSASSFKTYSCETNTAHVSSVGGASLEPDSGSPGLGVQLTDDCEAENSKSAKTFVEPEFPSADRFVDPAKGKENSPASLQQHTNSQLNSVENKCFGPEELLDISLDEAKLSHTMDDTFEIGAPVRSHEATVTPCHEATVTTCHELHVSHSNSISDDLLVDKTVSTTQSSSSVTDALDSGRRTSPLVFSACDVTLPIRTNSIAVNNACCSPKANLNNDGSTNVGSKTGPSDALESFKAVLGTLTRSKEIIARATQIAMDCAKQGTASRVVEILACYLENETSLHRRVDLFFLVDSITQCSQGVKGTIGGVFQQAIQSALLRLIPAAAPPGSSAQENRRQCLKVLRVWLERRIFPESIIRKHIRELDALCCSSSAGISSRSLKTERAFDDPIRQMEGMMVDEYGSNSSIQLPGFCMPPMMTDGDGGSDSDEENFEAVTPEHNTENREGSKAPAIEKHPHILEDVDGELEMEDVAPSSEADTSSTRLVDSVHSNFGNFEHVNLPFAPMNKQPSTPPMRVVSPAPPLPPPPSQTPFAITDSTTNRLQQKLYSSSVGMKDDTQESFGQRSMSSRVNSFRHHGPDRRSFHNPPTRMLDRHTQASSSAYNNQPLSHPSARPGSNIQASDASHKGYHFRPPHPGPSNQFSYVQSDQRMPSRRDVPPNPHRYHMAHCSDDGHVFRGRGRMKHAPRDVDDCWRSPAPPFSGPCHPDFSSLIVNGFLK
ncbi:hypothetical protein Leryth_013797 [Lithospermum erythrorhizon]|nr:hypothetical protein Leryth_013797 [Lithospermum erythrorhizon]